MLTGAARAGAAVAVATTVRPLGAAEAPRVAEKPVIWDSHTHLKGRGTPEESIDRLLVYADRLKVQRVVVFMGFSREHSPSPGQLRKHNDEVLRAIRHRPDRAFGFVYLNPNHVDQSVAELDRCVAEGPMIGIKLWIAMRCNHENLDPIVRRAVELEAPVLQHVYRRVGENQPGESSPSDLAELAARHPDAQFIAAHTGADWEKGIRAIRPTQNVWAEISGSDPTAGMVEMAVRELGAERVIYGSDAAGRSFASQLAKVYGADVPESDKGLMLGGNLRCVLAPILAAKEATYGPLQS